MHEGRYHRLATARFDPMTNSAVWTDRFFSGNTDRIGEARANARWRERRGITKNLPQQVLDMLSAIYATRSHPVRGEPGTAFAMPIFDDGRLTTLHMHLVGRERIELSVNGRPARFEALIVRPVIRTSGIFRSKGETRIWISDDARRWPLIVSSKILLGSITARLVRADNAAGAGGRGAPPDGHRLYGRRLSRRSTASFFFRERRRYSTDWR